MEALVYEAPREMVLRRLPVPVPGPGEVLVRVAYSGICGSELSGFLGQSSIRTPPLVFGHELAGRVESLGEGVAGLAVGQPVTANPLVTCGRCRYCFEGVEQRCPERLLLGASLPGCNAELVVVPASRVLAVPEATDLRQASLVEPAAFALHAVEAAAAPSSPALVVGAGPIGLLLVQALLAAGAPAPMVAELNPARAAMAQRAGAEVVALADVRGADLVFDAVGSEGTRQAGFAALAPGGTLVLVGLHTDATTLPLNRAVRDELTVRGVFAYAHRHVEEALAGIASGSLGLDEGVVEVPLADGAAWYQRLIDGDPAAKVLLVPGAGA
jgi:2-desacetyl-2-hydroxyethyl bacteriochlorophyllide A dehydrogenase